MPDEPNEIHGAAVTVHVTSPTSWLSSVMVSVLAMVPLMSAPEAVPAVSTRLTLNTIVAIGALRFLISHRSFRDPLRGTDMAACDPGDEKKEP
jgi:hypothetical protein